MNTSLCKKLKIGKTGLNALNLNAAILNLNTQS